MNLLSRVEILFGVQRGIYKDGDIFEEAEGGKLIVVKESDCCTHIAWKEHADERFNGKIADLLYCSQERWRLVVQHKFSINDWVYRDHLGDINIGQILIFDPEGTIASIDLDGKGNKRINFHVNSLRKATPEEIAQEKRRRLFAKIWREMNEFKVGDIVIGGAGDLLEVENVGDLLSCKQFHPSFQLFERFNVEKDSVKLVVPVEKRLDSIKTK